jgi:hypothetical protein
MRSTDRPPLLQHGRQAELDLDVSVVDKVVVDPRDLEARLDGF